MNPAKNLAETLHIFATEPDGASRTTRWSTRFEGHGLDVVTVHEALDRLAAPDGHQAQVMTLR
jgi:hypothetical protein